MFKLNSLKVWGEIKGENVSIDLHQLAQRQIGPLTRVLIGDAQPKMRLVGPIAQPYKVEVGIRGSRYELLSPPLFPTVLTLVRSRGKSWPRREASTSAGHCIATSPPLRHLAMPLRPCRPRLEPAGPWLLRHLTTTHLHRPSLPVRCLHRRMRSHHGNRKVFLLAKYVTPSIYHYSIQSTQTGTAKLKL